MSELDIKYVQVTFVESDRQASFLMNAREWCVLANAGHMMFHTLLGEGLTEFDLQALSGFLTPDEYQTFLQRLNQFGLDQGYGRLHGKEQGEK